MSRTIRTSVGVADLDDEHNADDMSSLLFEATSEVRVFNLEFTDNLALALLDECDLVTHVHGWLEFRMLSVDDEYGTTPGWTIRLHKNINIVGEGQHDVKGVGQ